MVTLRVTATVCGVFDAAASAIVIVSVYWPPARPVGLTVTVIVSVSVVVDPDVGDSSSHAWVFVAVQLRVPCPVFVTSIVCGGGGTIAPPDAARPVVAVPVFSYVLPAAPGV